MNILILDLPQSADDYAEWLENQLVSPDFGELLSELRALASGNAGTGPAATLDAILGDQKSQVLESGLRCLTPQQVRELLKNPDALEDLLFEIHISDSEYWQLQLPAMQIPESAIPPELRERADKQAVTPVLKSDVSDAPKTSRPAATSRRSWWIGAVLATAAVVLVMFSLRQPEAPNGWGWQRSDVFTAQLTAPEYLQHLADSANQWFNKTPTDRDSLRTRLAEFREGCDQLIEAPHPQLADTDRKWLVERCRAWSTKLDEHIAALDQGESFEDVQRDADETVMRLINAIEERAESLNA